MLYDGFISYKKSDEKSGLTRDYAIARRLQKQIAYALGLNVFFSDEEMEKSGRSNFAATIDEALAQAKFLVIACTEAKYLTTEWVEREWRQFLKMAEQNPQKAANAERVYVYMENPKPALLPAALADKECLSTGNYGTEKLLRFIGNALGLNTDFYVCKNCGKIIFRDSPDGDDGCSYHPKTYERILSGTQEYVKFKCCNATFPITAVYDRVPVSPGCIFCKHVPCRESDEL